VLASLGVDDTELERMRANKPPSEARLAAVNELARSILLHRGKVDDVAVSRATAAGVTSQEILEIVAPSTDIVPRRAASRDR
jgi:alkylhydroperoxidase family enzyme